MPTRPRQRASRAWRSLIDRQPDQNAKDRLRAVFFWRRFLDAGSDY
jgi:hypothetical protein